MKNLNSKSILKNLADPANKNKISASSSKSYKNNPIFLLANKTASRFKGKSHSPATKSKMSLSMTFKQDGEKNSQFGTCWVTNGVKPIKIKKEQLDEYLTNGYSRGRK